MAILNNVTPAQAARWACTTGIALTLLIMFAALGPFGPERAGGDMIFSLIIAPILAIWAMGPYAVANRFAQDAQGSVAWVYVIVQVLVGVPILVLYADSLVFRPDPDAHIGLVLSILPIYQFVPILAAYYGVRVWQRRKP